MTDEDKMSVNELLIRYYILGRTQMKLEAVKLLDELYQDAVTDDNEYRYATISDVLTEFTDPDNLLTDKLPT